MKLKSKLLKVVLGILLLLIIFGIGSIGYNRYMINKESKMYKPLGEMVTVKGHKMSIYVEGSGDKTLVFMSGSGTSSPILDFMTLARELKDDYRIVIVEKFGYGFSDTTDISRDLDVILDETRTGLSEAGITGPYILCPHSMSGIEALYWTEKYPEEVEAIAGLDMAVKETYNNFEPSSIMLWVSSLAARAGVLRFIPGSAESDAIKYGNLTSHEKEMYRAIFYRKTQTTNMVNEIKQIKQNSKKLGNYSNIKVPVILFSSNGNGTGFDADYWCKCQKNFIDQISNGQLIELHCTHYVHDIAYEEIADAIKADF